MEIKLDGEAAASIASAAIFESMTVEARENAMKQALQYLMTPSKDRNSLYPTGQTPLQNAFNQALQSVAFRVVEEKIKNDPQVIDAVNKLLGPMLLGALEGEAEHWDSTLADKIGSAVGAWLADKARESRS